MSHPLPRPAGPCLGLIGLLALAGGAARAEPRPVAVGPYAEAGFGATGLLGNGGKYSHVGPAFGLRVGYDLWSWLSIGARLELSSHEAAVPPPPRGEYFQLYDAAADGRIGFRLGPVGVFADGGVGLAVISTNVLEKVALLDPGERVTPLFSVGGGLEYHLVNRHYGFGLAGQWSLLPAFASTQAASGRLYLRYTY